MQPPLKLCLPNQWVAFCSPDGYWDDRELHAAPLGKCDSITFIGNRVELEGPPEADFEWMKHCFVALIDQRIPFKMGLVIVTDAFSPTKAKRQQLCVMFGDKDLKDTLMPALRQSYQMSLAILGREDDGRWSGDIA